MTAIREGCRVTRELGVPQRPTSSVRSDRATNLEGVDAPGKRSTKTNGAPLPSVESTTGQTVRYRPDVDSAKMFSSRLDENPTQVGKPPQRRRGSKRRNASTPVGPLPRRARVNREGHERPSRPNTETAETGTAENESYESYGRVWEGYKCDLSLVNIFFISIFSLLGALGVIRFGVQKKERKN